MIRGFKDRRTQRFFGGQSVRAFHGFADQATRRLTVLDNADSLTRSGWIAQQQAGASLRRPNGPVQHPDQPPVANMLPLGDDGPYDVEVVDYHR